MEAMEEEVVRTAHDLIDDLLPRGTCDLLTEFARPMTLLTMLRTLGLPEDDLPAINQLGDDLLAIFTDGLNPIPDDVRRATCQRSMRISGQYADIVAARPAQPPDSAVLARLSEGTDAQGCPRRPHP